MMVKPLREHRTRVVVVVVVVVVLLLLLLLLLLTTIIILLNNDHHHRNDNKVINNNNNNNNNDIPDASGRGVEHPARLGDLQLLRYRHRYYYMCRILVIAVICLLKVYHVMTL